MATAPAAKAKTETVSTRQLASQLAEKHELSQKSANAMSRMLYRLRAALLTCVQQSLPKEQSW